MQERRALGAISARAVLSWARLPGRMAAMPNRQSARRWECAQVLGVDAIECVFSLHVHLVMVY